MSKDKPESNSRRDVVVGTAALMAGLVAAQTSALGQEAAPPTAQAAMDTAQFEKRLQRLEEQNERILDLLEKIATSSLTYKGKKLPEEEPDFAKIEKTLRAVLAEPEIAAVFELGEFKTKEWICQAVILHKVKDLKPHWRKLQAIVKTVSAECKVPGRVAGSFMDPNDPQRMIGSTLEFGYSPEVGYDYPNEFYQESLKERKENGD